MDNGTPKYRILIPYEHPELEKQEKIDVEVRINNRHFEKGYCYEISFIDSESLPYKPSSDKNSTKYKEGRKFIEDLEAEFNKKTGKEAIVNRTSQQEQELKDKKQQLAELENQQQTGGDPKKPTNYWPWIIGGVILVLHPPIIVLIIKEGNKKLKVFLEEREIPEQGDSKRISYNLVKTLEVPEYQLGLQPTDYNFCAWLRDTKHLTPEQVLNHSNEQELRQEYQTQTQIKEIAVQQQPPK
ncbi:7290_t:CDS:2 [Ambispora leptoticha]|uniref:7290_t:CDS:1 n=1 Tax=Ambispora leptoticha TaxID=144679 RepID=A0A9N9A058_9GLOM|nr:7290_t:CDS:2 [Ambispora leptoticha]